MAIGTFGDVVFEASSDKVRTFTGLSFSRSARYAEHDVYMSKPVLDYLGEGTTSASLSIRFDAMLGMNPAKELAELRSMMEKATAADLIIGSEPLGMFVIESMTEDFTSVDGHGRLLVASCSLTLKGAN